MSAECVTVIGIIAAALSGLGGTALGAHFAYKNGIKLVRATHKNAIQLMQRQEFNKAASNFRAVFVDETFHIRRNVEPFYQRFGERREEIEIANEKAKIIFEAYLPADMLIGFNAAWEQYKKPDEESKITESQLSSEYYKELGNIRLSYINSLLEYAKRK
ncbi:MAG: hypothetical protein WCO53_14615 [Deltaproteobacteria bacterium]